MRVPLVGGAYQSKSIIANAQRCVNLYPEANPPSSQAPVPVTHYPTPGLKRLDTTIVGSSPSFTAPVYPSKILSDIYVVATGTNYASGVGIGQTPWPTKSIQDSIAYYSGTKIIAGTTEFGPYLSGSSTGLLVPTYANLGTPGTPNATRPYDFDIDLNGQAYVISRTPTTGTSYTYTINVFAYQATGNTAPIATISGSPLPTFDFGVDGEIEASICLDLANNIYVGIKNVVYKFTALSGGATIGSILSDLGDVYQIGSICYDSFRSWLWVADTGLWVKTAEFPSTPAIGISSFPKVLAIDLAGMQQRRLTYSGFACPSHLAVAPDGTIYVADSARYSFSLELVSGVSLTAYPGATAIYAFDQGANGSSAPVRTISFLTSGAMIYNAPANPPEAYIPAASLSAFAGLEIERTTGNLIVLHTSGGLFGGNTVGLSGGIFRIPFNANGLLSFSQGTGGSVVPLSVINEVSDIPGGYFILAVRFKG